MSTIQKLKDILQGLSGLSGYDFDFLAGTSGEGFSIVDWENKINHNWYRKKATVQQNAEE